MCSTQHLLEFVEELPLRDHAPNLNITTPPDLAFPKFQLAESSKHLSA